MREVADRHAAVQMLVYNNSLYCQRVAPARFVQLEYAVFQRDRVVVMDSALMLRAENPIQIFTQSPHKGTPFLRRRNSKLAVELGDVITLEKLIASPGQ